MATAIMHIENFNFSTMKKNGEIRRGISEGGLFALSKHNERTELDFTQENKFIKSKKSNNEHIDKTKSQDNIYYKKLSGKAVAALEEKKVRKNGVGAFSLVFDFQDLKDESISDFGKNHSQKFKNLIDEFLEKFGITERFEILENVLHLDEKNPHFHFVFSAWDNKKNEWGYNEFFNSISEPEIVKDKNGEVLYQIENRGAKKGKFKLDEFGNKIPKTKKIYKSKIQDFQNEWKSFIEEKTKNKISNKKEFSSMLAFTNSVYREFTKEQKAKLTELRQMEKVYYASSDENKKINKNKFLMELVKFNDVALEISDRLNNNKLNKNKSIVRGV